MPSAEEKKSVEEPEEDEVVLSMEDEDTLTPEVEPEKEVVKMPEPEDDVLEAEIMDAEIMVDEAPVMHGKESRHLRQKRPHRQQPCSTWSNAHKWLLHCSR